ncbi:hypothetical protein GLP43_08055 [Sulfitobacter sp. M39]|uniref:hypothetical protein n=1 Tax=Sulfitobacter sp. M39 TaxID=2675334 RepID=UPI001F41A58D|nr:hypothetical protein [Sulfitobacter sp. M39]MCF7747519.1 hypothetical protein [Sulfitobacter sp. M39]
MNVYTIQPASKATLTQNQLFNLYLDAPCRDGGKSALSAVKFSEDSIFERYFPTYCSDTECLPDELGDDIAEALRTCEEPLVELEAVFNALEVMAVMLRVIKNDFERLAEETRTPEPGPDATDHEYSQWEDNPRYIIAGVGRTAV